MVQVHIISIPLGVGTTYYHFKTIGELPSTIDTTTRAG